MRKLVVSLALALAAAYTVEAGYRVVQLGEVIALARQGLSDRTIVSFLEGRELDFFVGTDEILRLREAGVGEPVIRYLIERTAPREPYSSGPYADGPRDRDYGDYGYAGSPYDDPGYGRAYVEYVPRSYYVGAALGPYVAYDGYYGGGLFGWLGRTFGVGHHYGRYDWNRYDHWRGRRDYDRGRGYRYDYGRGYRDDRGYRYDRGYGRSYSYTYRSSPGRSYAIGYGRSTGHRDRGHYTGDRAVPRGGGHSGGRGRH